MPLIVVVASLLVVLSVPVLVFTLVTGRSDGRVTRNLREGLGHPTDLRRLVLSQSPTERVWRPVVAALATQARRWSPVGVVANLERRIVLAGMTMPVEVVLVAKLVLTAALGAAGIGVFLWSPSLRTAAVAGFLTFAGYVGPDALLARQVTRRKLSMRHELPDLLDQVTICVEAGLGFDAALARSAQGGATPLTQEINRMHRELRIGVPRREALDNLLARTDVAELRQFAHAIIQAETYGVPVSQMLRAQATEHRERRRQDAEERAMKLPVKITFPLVLCILPAMFIVILGPAVIDLLNSGF